MLFQGPEQSQEQLPGPVPKVDSPITKVRKLIFYEWQKITNDLWILDTVKNGYKIEFSVFPNYSSFLPEIQFSTEKAGIVTA